MPGPQEMLHVKSVCGDNSPREWDVTYPRHISAPGGRRKILYEFRRQLEDPCEEPCEGDPSVQAEDK
eukprot:6005966-Pyramimonas_sp.AAC.3